MSKYTKKKPIVRTGMGIITAALLPGGEWALYTDQDGPHMAPAIIADLKMAVLESDTDTVRATPFRLDLTVAATASSLTDTAVPRNVI